eukprot:3594375-Pyramimonas_sp.AAC.1
MHSSAGQFSNARKCTATQHNPRVTPYLRGNIIIDTHSGATHVRRYAMSDTQGRSMAKQLP